MINQILMIKQKLETQKSLLSKSAILFVATIFTGGLLTTGLAQADSLQSKINKLEANNNELREEKQELTGEAESIEAKISNLRGEIAALEGHIRDNRAKAKRLESQIAAMEDELAGHRELLGKNIRAMYLEDEISTIEMLASSKNLSEFVDKEQYRLTVKDKIKSTLDKIKKLQDKLKSQKESVDKLITDQRDMQSQLDEQRAEQRRLLALNQSERNKLDNELRANSGKIAELRRQQAAANARFLGGGVVNRVDGSGYPWASYPFPNASPDSWGMYKRQCVSYTAWKVAASGRHMPYWGGRGNANRWPGNARAAGIPVDGKPRVGDVAVSMAGYYGHTMYVEAVHGDGTISISQYNAGWDGRYSEARISARGLQFIHFP